MQKVESIGKLAGGIAHDFNNLLAVIGGYASHLLISTPLRSGISRTQRDPECGRNRGAAHSATPDFSRRRASNPEALNLNGIVERDCSMLRRTFGEEYRPGDQSRPVLGLVRVDPVEISQVLLNLLVNARDATPGGGKLMIASSNATISDGQGSVVPAVPPGNMCS